MGIWVSGVQMHKSLTSRAPQMEILHAMYENGQGLDKIYDIISPLKYVVDRRNGFAM
jgi:hypothetical protein